MTRKRLSAVTMFVLATVTVATAAYAPHSATLAALSRKTAYVAPCSTTIALRSEGSFAARADTTPYPVPSPEVIARGHSAAIND